MSFLKIPLGFLRTENCNIYTMNEKKLENNEVDIKNYLSTTRIVLKPSVDTFIEENSLFTAKKPWHFLMVIIIYSDVSFRRKQNG